MISLTIDISDWANLAHVIYINHRVNIKRTQHGLIEGDTAPVSFRVSPVAQQSPPNKNIGQRFIDLLATSIQTLFFAQDSYSNPC